MPPVTTGIPRSERQKEIVVTCPSCSNAEQNLFAPSLNEVVGRQVRGGPTPRKIAFGLPVEVVHTCTNCSAESTWDLVQSDPRAKAINYELRS